MTTAIVCGSGGYRTVFIHGALSEFETAGFRAEAYAGTSASGLPAACAAVGASREIGADYWQKALAMKTTVERGMSDVMLISIAEWGDYIRARLFQPGMPRYLIPASLVINETAAAQTQSEQARRLGRKLLLAAARRQAEPWVQENLESHLFDTHGEPRLTPENFDEVLYASTRMMHAWDVPAWIQGKPYIDASYLCAIPAVEVAEKGYDEVIAIAADPPGALYRDIFGTWEVPHEHHGVPIHLIMPDYEVGKAGADFTDATPEGLVQVYEHGREKARQFLDKRKL